MPPTPPPDTIIFASIPGDPPPGARPRARIGPVMSAPLMLAKARNARSMADLMGLFRASIYHPRAGDMRTWMKAAEMHLERSRRAVVGSHPIVPKGAAVEIWIQCVFELPRSRWLKKAPRPRIWETRANVGDWDNLGKPVCDVATGVLWHDDSQVARATIEKVTGAQGEPARLDILVRALTDSPAQTIFQGVLDQARVAGLVDPPDDTEVHYAIDSGGRRLPF